MKDQPAAQLMERKSSIRLQDNRHQSAIQKKQIEAMQKKGKVSINDHTGLEKEADVMGGKASQKTYSPAGTLKSSNPKTALQLNAIKYSAPQLSEKMIERFDEAYELFNNKILAESPLAKGRNNQVVVHGVSQGSHKMKNLGQTLVYIGNDGYDGEDYNQFTNLWEWSIKNPIPETVAVRIVITVNLTANASIEQVYATLLHEWYVHAVKWEGTVEYIRNKKGLFAVAWIQGQGSEKRAAGEHKAFANWSDEEIENKVDSIGLLGVQRTKVIENMKKDRKEHK